VFSSVVNFYPHNKKTITLASCQMTPLELFYQSHTEEIDATLIYLRDLILQQDENITPEWKYGGPFFSYKGKMFCFLWIHKKYKQAYICVVEGNRFSDPDLLKEDRVKMKILLIDHNRDIDVVRIKKLVHDMLAFYKDGTIKTKFK
jgi:hypothetical protein